MLCLVLLHLENKYFTVFWVETPFEEIQLYDNIACMGLWTELYSSPKFICWRLNPHVTLFGDRAYKEVIIIKWDHRVGLKFDRIGVLLRRGRNTRVPSFWKHTPEFPLSESTKRLWKDTVRRSYLQAGKKGLTRNKPCLHPDLDPATSELWEERKICCLSHSVWITAAQAS